ncbi:MAG: chorismate-binding protein, partial [Planctomycetes bacterium]|nr:chorismate-binding protein [Planctomycetota bacterium]
MMHSPKFEEFSKLATRGNLVPVYRQLMGDIISPVLAFSRLDDSSHAFLLESVTGGEKISRYSFIGIDPAIIFKSTGHSVEITDTASGEVKKVNSEAPLDVLQEIIDQYEHVHLPALPRFSGGAVGYFGYDVVRQVENLPNPPERSLGLPEIYLGIYKSMLVFDNVNKTCMVIVHADCRDGDARKAYDEATAKVDAIVNKLSAPVELPIDDVPVQPTEDLAVDSNFDKEEFKTAVDKCKEYIRAGDIFQIVLSQRLSAPCTADPFEVYRNIRVINPSPYMFYLKYPELSLVGASPEVMVRVEDGQITLRPIAGTRPRGKTEADDLALEKDLLDDPKELAEHTMLVDLGRNDVGRVSEYGKVSVTEKMVVERYSHVMHIVSNVEGTLKKDYSPLEALKSCLPAGTLSGSPKIRAMEIIDEFEPDVRGPYGGAVGYLDFTGN